MSRKQRVQLTCEKYEIIVRMHNNGKKITEICNDVGLHRVTVGKVISDFINGVPFVPSSLKFQRAINSRNITFDTVEQCIFNTVVCNNSFIQKEILNSVEEQTGEKISQSKVSRKLKKMDFTRKRLSLIPIERNSQERINSRAIYCAEIFRIPMENLVFLDETGFNQHVNRSYGYSLRNTSAYVNVPANRGTNRSLMCAISLSGVLAFKYVTGSFNAQLFIEFIQINLVPYFQQHPQKILIMDNCRFHHSRAVLAIFLENNIAHRFLPAYSPQLNPIEEFFSMLKSRFTSLRLENSERSIEDTLEILCLQDFSIECNGFFINMRRWLNIGIAREPFLN